MGAGRYPCHQRVRELRLASRTQALMQGQMVNFQTPIVASLARSMPDVMENPADNVRLRAQVAADVRSMREQLQWRPVLPRIIAMYQARMDQAGVLAVSAF